MKRGGCPLTTSHHSKMDIEKGKEKSKRIKRKRETQLRKRKGRKEKTRGGIAHSLRPFTQAREIEGRE